MSISAEDRIVVHLDGYFDNPSGNFEIEEEVLASHGIRLVTIPEEVKHALPYAKVIFFRAVKLGSTEIAQFSSCRTMIRYGIGLDNIDIPEATKRGIAVCNLPEFCLEEMADHTLALALATARNLSSFSRSLQQGASVRSYPVHSIQGSRFTTLGFGRIAQRVLERARAFGWEVAAHDPYLSGNEIEKRNVRSLTFEEALRTSDYLSLHCPLTPQTTHLLNKQTFMKMKPHAILINTARGGLVDTEALLQALESRTLRAVGLDVTDPEPLTKNHPLLRNPNALITPHMAWYSLEAERRLRRQAAEEALRTFQKQPLRYQVNKTLE